MHLKYDLQANIRDSIISSSILVSIGHACLRHFLFPSPSPMQSYVQCDIKAYANLMLPAHGIACPHRRPVLPWIAYRYSWYFLQEHKRLVPRLPAWSTVRNSTTAPRYLSIPNIDVLNKDCRRSISAILTWVLENVKISARPLNSIGN